MVTYEKGKKRRARNSSGGAARRTRRMTRRGVIYIAVDEYLRRAGIHACRRRYALAPFPARRSVISIALSIPRALLSVS